MNMSEDDRISVSFNYRWGDDARIGDHHENHKDYLDEATQPSPVCRPNAIELHAKGTHTFLDVRDSGDVAKSGTVAGAVRVPPG